MLPDAHWPVSPYTLFLVVGVLSGTSTVVYRAIAARLHPADYAPLIAVCTVAALLGSKLYSIVERGGFYYPYTHQVTGWSIEALYGYRYPGGVLGFLAGIAVAAVAGWRRLSLGAIADLFAPSFGVAMGVTRIGCFLTGCCFGTLSNLPWAVQFPAGSKAWALHVDHGWLPPDAAASLPVHPLQIYCGLYDFALAAFLLWWEPRKRYDGQLFLLLIALHGSGKVMLESLRFEAAPHLQLAAVVFALIGWGGLVVARTTTAAGWGAAGKAAPAP